MAEEGQADLQMRKDMEKVRDIAAVVPLPVILAFMHKRFLETERWEEADAIKVAIDNLERMKGEERILRDDLAHAKPPNAWVH